MSTVLRILTIVAELSIAIVIYYEIEQNRLERFLSEASDELIRSGRRLLYTSYMQTEGDNIGEKAANFSAVVRKNAELRSTLDLQLMSLMRALYLMRRSALRPIVVSWHCPPVVRMWATLYPLVEERMASESVLERTLLFRFIRDVLGLVAKDNISIGIYSGDAVMTLSFDDINLLRKRVEKCLRELP